MRVLPINVFKNKINPKKIFSSSILALSILSASSINSCSKLNKPIIQDKFEKEDSTKVEEPNIEFVIDTTYNVIEHEITI